MNLRQKISWLTSVVATLLLVVVASTHGQVYRPGFRPGPQFTYVAPQVLRVIANNGGLPSYAGPTVATGNTMLKERVPFKVLRASSYPVFGFTTNYLPGNTSGATFTFHKAAVECPAGVTQITMGGSTADYPIAANTVKVLTDAPATPLTANVGDLCYLRAEFAITATASSYASRATVDSSGTGGVTTGTLQAWQYAPLAEVDDVVATGSMTAPTGAVATTFAIYPVAMLGQTPITGVKSVMGCCTSIQANQTGETTGGPTVAGGYLRLAANQKNEPYINAGINGGKDGDFIGGSAGNLIQAWLPYVDTFFIGGNTNDIYNQGLTASQVVARQSTLGGYGKAANSSMYVITGTILPRGTSTDLGVLPANFTSYTEYLNGGVADQVNVIYRGIPGTPVSNIDAVADDAAVVAWSSDHTKWAPRPWAGGTLNAAMTATAGSASINMTTPGNLPPLYESLAFDPFNANSQKAPSTFFVARTLTGSTSPYTATTSSVSTVGVAQNAGNAVWGRPNDGGTHPCELSYMAMATVVAAQLP